MDPLRTSFDRNQTPAFSYFTANQQAQERATASDAARADSALEDMRAANDRLSFELGQSCRPPSARSTSNKRPRTGSWPKGPSDTANAFSKSVGEQIRRAKANGATHVDLRGECVRLQHLRSYLSSLKTIDPEIATRSAHTPQERHPTLIISKTQIERELLAEEPTRRESMEKILTTLLCYPTDQGAITLTEDDGSRTGIQCQIQWLKQEIETASHFTGLWQILDGYRRNHLQNTYKGDYFYCALKPFINRYEEFDDEPHVRRRLSALDNFFGQLTSTKEYQNQPTQPLLTSRAYSVLEHMHRDTLLFDQILNDAEENLRNCGDRRAVVLLDMEMRCQIHDLIHTPHNEVQLFTEGMKYLRLNLMENMAWKELAKQKRPRADEEAFLNNQTVAQNQSESVEMLLYFRTHLNDLGLPNNTSIMQHPDGQFSMPENFMERMRENVHQGTQDLATVQNFFHAWEPWQHHIKRAFPAVFEDNNHKAHQALEALDSQCQKHHSHYWNDPVTMERANAIAKAREEKEQALISELSTQRIQLMHRAFCETRLPGPPQFLSRQYDAEVL